MKIRVLIVGISQMFQAGIRTVLQNHPDFLIASIESLYQKKSEAQQQWPRPLPLRIQPKEDNHESQKFTSLTTREREIARLIGNGLKNKDVADRLRISEITVRHHLTSIF